MKEYDKEKAFPVCQAIEYDKNFKNNYHRGIQKSNLQSQTALECKNVLLIDVKKQCTLVGPAFSYHSWIIIW